MEKSFNGKKEFQTVLIFGKMPAKRISVVQRERDQNDGDVQSESAEKQCLFRAQLEQTSTGKAVSCVNIGNIINNSHL